MLVRYSKLELESQNIDSLAQLATVGRPIAAAWPIAVAWPIAAQRLIVSCNWRACTCRDALSWVLSVGALPARGGAQHGGPVIEVAFGQQFTGRSAT